LYVPLFRLFFMSPQTWRSLSDTPHPVRLLWSSDQPVAETATWQHAVTWNRHPRFAAGFELAIPASKRPQIHALDRAATGTDRLRVCFYRKCPSLYFAHLMSREICIFMCSQLFWGSMVLTNLTLTGL
jgi:hypothetical protein